MINQKIVEIIDSLSFYSSKANKAHTSFVFKNKKYKYLTHKYNYTWRNERIIEIPIALNIVKNNSNKKILEVGNVLSHYFPINHLVLDKYEKAPGVINQDVISYSAKEKYDLIIAISTLEHVGFDESPKDSTKILKALGNMKRLLNPGGTIVLTLPIGYNPYLDKIIKNKKIDFSSVSFMKRVSKNNKWEQSSYEQVKNLKYNYPYPNANAILVGFIEK